MYAQTLAGLLGIWLMAAPHSLGYDGLPRDHDQIVGPIIATFGIMAASEVLRVLRWVNLPLGLWLLAAPWILGFATTPLVNDMVTGALVVALSLIKGRTPTPYAGRWAALWRDPLPGIVSHDDLRA